jgi:hypothetical protein
MYQRFGHARELGHGPDIGENLIADDKILATDTHDAVA